MVKKNFHMQTKCSRYNFETKINKSIKTMHTSINHIHMKRLTTYEWTSTTKCSSNKIQPSWPASEAHYNCLQVRLPGSEWKIWQQRW